MVLVQTVEKRPFLRLHIKNFVGYSSARLALATELMIYFIRLKVVSSKLRPDAIVLDIVQVLFWLTRVYRKYARLKQRRQYK